MKAWSFFNRTPDLPVYESGISSCYQKEIGKFRFRFQDERGGVSEDSVELSWKDFNDHLLITGGSGSGKTSTVLHQVYEGLVFRSAYHSDVSIRSQYQVGGLVIEAKGDFTPKTKVLARRYQREESIVYFGPDHPQWVYDPFSDPTELPLQKANKIQELIKAASGGKEEGDPFWSQASQKLLTNLFLLHDRLLKSGVSVPAISFHYLNLLCLDKQQDESGERERQDSYRTIRGLFKSVRKSLMEIEEEWEGIDFKSSSENSFRGQLRAIAETIHQMQSEGALGFDNDRGKEILNLIEGTREEWSRLLAVLSWDESKNLREKRSILLAQGEEIQEVWRGLAKLFSERKKRGALEELLSQYESLLREKGESLESDWIYSYFINEYLNPANEKTSASVSMVVSNALMPFVTPPFDRMFSPQATFNFTQVIDQGLLVVLEMPSAQYGVAQRLASLVMKIDFFRTTLNRSRLRILLEKRMVNQDRNLIYLCDEFGSVATTGDQTGEASFLDKVREYRCSCILAMQGLPSLLRKFSEQEVDALLQNCGLKIFLRNDDPKTNDYASRALGSEIKVRLNQNQGAMEHWIDSKRKWGSRGYSTSYEKGARFSSDQFVTFRIGEGVLRFPARFGDLMVRRVRFDFNPI